MIFDFLGPIFGPHICTTSLTDFVLSGISCLGRLAPLLLPYGSSEFSWTMPGEWRRCTHWMRFQSNSWTSGWLMQREWEREREREESEWKRDMFSDIHVGIASEFIHWFTFTNTAESQLYASFSFRWDRVDISTTGNRHGREPSVEHTCRSML